MSLPCRVEPSPRQAPDLLYGRGAMARMELLKSPTVRGPRAQRYRQSQATILSRATGPDGARAARGPALATVVVVLGCACAQCPQRLELSHARPRRVSLRSGLNAPYRVRCIALLGDNVPPTLNPSPLST